MADQNQQSSNPDLKMAPPSNLPTGRPGADIAVSSRPVIVPPPPPLTAPPIPPRPAPTVPPPAAVPPRPITVPPTPPVTPPPAPTFQSSVRTMQQDLAALQKGQAPTPFNIQSRPLPPPPPGGPPRLTPVAPAPQVSLGGTERTKTLPAAPLPHPTPPGQSWPLMPPPPPIASMAVPPPGKKPFSRTGLIVILAVLIVGGAAAWYFYHPSNKVAEETPTVSYSSTPRPTPLVEGAFTTVLPVTAAVGPDYFTTVKSQIDPNNLAVNDPVLYRPFVTLASSSASERLTFSRFAVGTGGKFPATLTDAALDNQLYLTLMRKSDGQISQGFIVKLQPAADVKAALTAWEVTMANDLAKLFNVDPKKAASKTFLDNSYSTPPVAIRYRNFPDPGMTIDYAVVTAPNGDRYLVFANSKSHTYAVIDRLLTIGAGATPLSTPNLSETPIPGK